MKKLVVIIAIIVGFFVFSGDEKEVISSDNGYQNRAGVMSKTQRFIGVGERIVKANIGRLIVDVRSEGDNLKRLVMVFDASIVDIVRMLGENSVLSGEVKLGGLVAKTDKETGRYELSQNIEITVPNVKTIKRIEGIFKNYESVSPEISQLEIEYIYGEMRLLQAELEEVAMRNAEQKAYDMAAKEGASISSWSAINKGKIVVAGVEDGVDERYSLKKLVRATASIEYILEKE